MIQSITNNSPLLSVFMITYNHEDFISQAIDGILMQKANFSFEIIIGEDCSKDNTRKIIIDYANKYPEIVKPILYENNVGMMQNTINVLKACKGKYLAFCEGDDYWTDPCKLQKQVDILESNPELSLCFHDFKLQKGNDLFENDIAKVPATITSKYDICKQNYIQTCTVVARNIVDNLPGWFDTRLNAGDYPLYMLWSEIGNFYYLNESMAVYRIHPGGIFTSAKREALLRGNFYLLTTLANHASDKIVKSTLKSRSKKVFIDLLKEFLNQKKYKLFYQEYFPNMFKLPVISQVKLGYKLIKSLIKI